MSHLTILEHFKSLLPQFEKFTKEWFNNGPDSIRIRDIGGVDYVFTYHERADWRFETVDSYLNSMKEKLAAKGA